MPPHWLAKVGATKCPEVVVCFDTETRWSRTPKGEVHTLRCWDAIVRHRHGKDGVADRVVWAKGEEAYELADALEISTEVIGETWALAHNIGFDLTVTQLPVILGTRGWHPQFVHLGDESAVFILKRGKAKLVLTDSWSWLRASLEEAAKDVKMRKLVLPEEQDDLASWHRRCKHDVMILDRLMSTVMTWWEAHDLGAFGTTGAACGWRGLRANTTEKKILVGPDEERTALERRAIFGGRKEVYQVGTFTGSWIADRDLVAAYPTAAAAFPLPTQPIRKGWHVVDGAVGPAVVADYVAPVEITTEVPCAPVKINGEVWWPTGTFRTTLTGPELRHIEAAGAKIDYLEVPQWYRMTKELADWATWCIDLQSDITGKVPPVIKRIAKGWGRSVIGRFALKTSELISERPATTLGWHVESGYELETGAPLQIISYGGTEYTYRQDVDGSEVNPAILAFVEGYVRVAMSQALADIEPTKLLQCNTDGWWEKRADPYRSGESMPGPWPFQIVRKALTREINVLGPNHVQTPAERRFAGIPRDAETTVSGKKAWLDWPGLRWQMEHSEPGEYVKPLREAVLEEHYCKRWVLANGETVPVTTTVDQDGTTRILPWSSTLHRWEGDELADHQVATLQPLADDLPAILVAPRGSYPRLTGRRGHLI